MQKIHNTKCCVDIYLCYNVNRLVRFIVFCSCKAHLILCVYTLTASCLPTLSGLSSDSYSCVSTVGLLALLVIEFGKHAVCITSSGIAFLHMHLLIKSAAVIT
jgi:hypothetical protein